jgi:hypothetical protein
MAGPIDAEGLSVGYRKTWCDRLLTKDETENMPEP